LNRVVRWGERCTGKTRANTVVIQKLPRKVARKGPLEGIKEGRAAGFSLEQRAEERKRDDSEK